MATNLSLDFQTNLLSQLNQSAIAINNLNSNLQINIKKQENIADIISNSNKINQSTNGIYKNNNQELIKTVDRYNDIKKISKNILNNTENLGRVIESFKGAVSAMFGTLSALIPATAIVNAINDVKKYQQTFLDLSYRMGQSGKAIAPYTEAMHQITRYTGISNENATELISTLAKFRVSTQDIASLGKTTGLFADVTGLSYQNSALLSGELMRTGRLGKQSTQSILLGMAKVQRIVGITDEEMQELSDNIITNTRLLNNMGKTSSQIEAFSKTTTKLSAAFVQVGLKITDAQDILDRFLDPSKFEDNALLYAQLGYNLSDVINGSIPQEDIQQRLKGLSSQVKGMGMAGVELAKQLNIPYRTLTQMSEMKDVNPIDTTANGTKDVNQQLLDMQKQQEGIGRAMEHTVNQFSDKLTSALDKAMPFLTKFTKSIETFTQKIKINTLLIFAGIGFLLVKIFKSSFDNFRTSAARASLDTSNTVGRNLGNGIENGYKKPVVNMGNAVSSALSMNTEKGMKTFDRKRQIRLEIIETNKQNRRENSDDYQARLEKITYFNNLINAQQLGFTKKITGSTAYWMDRIQKGSKLSSGLIYSTEQLNVKMRERVELANRDITTLSYANKLILENKTIELNNLNERQEKLKTLISTTGALSESELIKAQKESKGLFTLINNLTEEIKKYNKNDVIDYNRSTKAKIKLINNLTNQQLINYKKEGDESALRLQEEIKEQSGKEAAANTTAEALRASTGQLNLQLKLMEQQGLMKGKDLIKYNEQKKLQADTNALLQQALQEESEAVQQKQLLLDKLEIEEAQQKLINTTLQNRKIGTGGQDLISGQIKKAMPLLDRMFGYMGTVGHNISSSFVSLGNKIATSAAVIGRNVSERLNPINWLANIKEAGLKGILLGREKTVRKYEKDESGNVVAKESLVQTKGMLGHLKNIAAGIGGLSLITGLLRGFQPILEPLKNIFSGVLDGIIKGLLPTIQNLAKQLLPILVKLANVLIPPVLKLLSAITFAAGFILQGIGDVIKTLITLPNEIGYFFKSIFKGKTREQSILEDVKNTFATTKIKNATLEKSLQKQKQDLLNQNLELQTKYNLFGSLSKEEMVKFNSFNSKIENIDEQLQNNRVVQEIPKEIQKTLEYLTNKNPKDYTKEDKDLINKLADSTIYGNNIVYSFATAIQDTGAALKITSGSINTLADDLAKKPLLDANAIAKSINESSSYIPPEAINNGEVSSPSKPVAGTPTTYSINNGKIEKVEEGSETKIQTEAVQTTADATKTTADNTATMAKNQATQADLQQLTYNELVKMNNNFSAFFAKAKIVPNEGIVLGRS